MRELLQENPIVPVVVVDSVDDGVNVGKALLRGGIESAEVCFRTSVAAEAIREMAQIEGLTVGAGTVINPQQAEIALKAGAQFLVSPGFSADVVATAQNAQTPILPGCADASWIMAALELGVDVVKFFPASNLGGVSMIKALAAAFPSVGFIPTGGVNAENLADYLALPAVAACGGSWMVKGDLVKAQAWEKISQLSAEALEIAQGVSK